MLDIKRLFIAVALIMFVSAFTGVYAQENKMGKIGFADFLSIYHSYYRTQEEDQRLKELGDEMQDKLDLEKAKITELEKKMNSGILSEDEKSKLQKDIEDAKIQASKKVQELNLEMDSERRNAIDNLVQELKDKVDNYGKENGYMMILDKNQVLFSDKDMDLTEEIIKYVNKDADSKDATE